MLSYLINVALLGMLCSVAVYMVIVNRRLRSLRSGQDEIGPMIEAYARITGEMTETVARLRQDAAESAASLEDSIQRAAAARDEVERSLALAKLEAQQLAQATAPRPSAAPGGAAETAPCRAAAASRPPSAAAASPAAEAPIRASAHEGPPPQRDPATAAAGAGAAPAPGANGETGEPRPWMPPRVSRAAQRREAIDAFYGDAPLPGAAAGEAG